MEIADAAARSGNVRAERGENALPASPGVTEELSNALASARAALTGFLDLVSLEARSAGLALMWMVIWAGVAAVCIAGAWIGIIAALVLWVVSLGVSPWLAALAVVALNTLAAAVLIYRCIGLSRNLLFSATRRQVAGEFPVNPSKT